MAKAKYNRQRMKSLLSSLERKYGKRQPQHVDKPLQNILLVAASEGLSETAARKAVRSLRSKYVDWNQIRVTRAFEVQGAMKLSGDDETGLEKANRVLSTISDIYRARGNLDLTPLKDAKNAELKRLLATIESLDKHEINAILLTAFQRPVLPFDDDIVRVCKRLGVVGERQTRAVAQKAVESLLEDEDYYPFYWLMREHALRYCHAEEPNCSKCPVRSRCPSKDQV